MKLDVPKRVFTMPETSAHQFQTPTGGRKRIGQTLAYQFCELPWQVPSYTVATAPSVVPAGQMIFVTDGDVGAPTLAISDGTDWKVANTDAAIADS